MKVFLFICVLAGPVFAVGPEDSFTEKSWEQLSSKTVSGWGRAALDIQPQKWKHGETDHFIIHFFRNGE